MPRRNQHAAFWLGRRARGSARSRVATASRACPRDDCTSASRNIAEKSTGASASASRRSASRDARRSEGCVRPRAPDGRHAFGQQVAGLLHQALDLVALGIGDVLPHRRLGARRAPQPAASTAASSIAAGDRATPACGRHRARRESPSPSVYRPRARSARVARVRAIIVEREAGVARLPAARGSATPAQRARPVAAQGDTVGEGIGVKVVVAARTGELSRMSRIIWVWSGCGIQMTSGARRQSSAARKPCSAKSRSCSPSTSMINASGATRADQAVLGHGETRARRCVAREAADLLRGRPRVDLGQRLLRGDVIPAERSQRLRGGACLVACARGVERPAAAQQQHRRAASGPPAPARSPRAAAGRIDRRSARRP